MGSEIKDDFNNTHRAEKMIIDDFVQNLKNDREHYTDHRKSFNKEMIQLNNIVSKEGGREEINKVLNNITRPETLYQYLNAYGKNRNQAQNGGADIKSNEIYDEILNATTPKLRERIATEKTQSVRSTEQTLEILDVAKKSGNLVQRANQLSIEDIPSMQKRKLDPTPTAHENEAQNGKFRPKNTLEENRLEKNVKPHNPMDLHSENTTQGQMLSLMITANAKLHFASLQNHDSKIAVQDISFAA